MCIFSPPVTKNGWQLPKRTYKKYVEYERDISFPALYLSDGITSQNVETAPTLFMEYNKTKK